MEINVTKKDLFNGKNASESAGDHLNEPMKLHGMFDFNDDIMNKETGEVTNGRLVCLVTDKGYISAPSKTFIDSCDKLVETFGDEIVGMEVTIVPSKSNAGRTFYRLQLV